MSAIDPFAIAATAALTASVGGVAGAVVGAAMGGLGRAGRRRRAQERAMREGMGSLLWRELKNIHTDAERNGGMTLEERRQLEYVYSAYSGLDYNGTGKRLYEDSMKTDILD